MVETVVINRNLKKKAREGKKKERKKRGTRKRREKREDKGRIINYPEVTTHYVRLKTRAKQVRWLLEYEKKNETLRRCVSTSLQDRKKNCDRFYPLYSITELSPIVCYKGICFTSIKHFYYILSLLIGNKLPLMCNKITKWNLWEMEERIK